MNTCLPSKSKEINVMRQLPNAIKQKMTSFEHIENSSMSLQSQLGEIIPTICNISPDMNN